MTDDTPRFELFRSQLYPLPPSRYRLTVETTAGDADLVVPLLYVDSGLGYNEAEFVELYFRRVGRGRIAAAFALPRGAQGLRFAPHAPRGELVLGRTRIRRVSRIERYGEYTTRLFLRHLLHPVAGMRLVWRTLRALGTGGGSGLLATLRAMESHRPGDYQTWIRRCDRLREPELVELRRRVEALDDPPLFSIVMPVFETPERLLREAIDSVRAQVYEHWELRIADDASTEPHVRRVLDELAHADRRIKVLYRSERGGIVQTLNSAFDLAQGAWTARLDGHDLLRPHSLAEAALEIARRPQIELIYTDEDRIDESGRRRSPCFKPDFSRELLRTHNYLNHLTIHRTENVRAVGGWRSGFEGCQDYDLNLRIFERIDPGAIRHLPKILYHWRVTEGSTAASVENESHAAGLRALTEHITRVGAAARVEPAPQAPFFRVRFSVPSPAPLVSLIIPTRDRMHLLRGCVESIRDKTTYENYEILIVDNGSVEDATARYLRELERSANVHVLPYAESFNYSAINNFAVDHARGTVLGLVNNDIEVISPDWLTELVSWAVQPDVGCVGAKLYYANNTIQHAGVILGLGGVAGHSHKYFPRDHDGYLHRLKVVQNLSAVTAACLVVRKEIYVAVGGFNERDLPVAFNDVDFCIKVREAGYHNVWTPYAELYHLESTSRGAEDTLEKRSRAKSERIYMQQRWGRLLQEDPYYSPHLTRTEENFSLAI